MKKTIFVITMFFAVTMAYAQVDENTTFESSYYNKTQPGFIINLNWERIPCEIQLKHPAALGENLILVKKADGYSAYKPKDIIGFSVNGDLWLTKPSLSMGKRFCRVLYDGPILVYENIDYVRTGDMTMQRNSQLKSYKFVEKEGEKMLAWSSIYIDPKRNLFPMIAENTDLTQRISSEGPSYTEDKVLSYISIYNDWYMEQHPDFKMRKNRATEKVEEERIHPIGGATLDEALANLTKGKKESLAEKVIKYDKIPIYFMNDESNIQSDGYDASGNPLKDKTDWFKEFSDDQKNDMYDFMIAEMNYTFKTDKFVKGEDYPGKKYDFIGQDIKAYVKLQVYGRYKMSDLNSQNEYDVTYALNSNVNFMELTDKGKFKKVGSGFFVEKCKKTTAGKFYKLSFFTGLIGLDCPVDGLKDKVRGDVDWIKKQYPTK